MAREIDFSKKLDDADRNYLRQRPWLIVEAEIQGHEGVRADVYAKAAPDDVDEDEDDETTDYSKMTVAQLQKEIDSRNEELDEDDQIERSGNKADLIARLQEDDEAQE